MNDYTELTEPRTKNVSGGWWDSLIDVKWKRRKKVQICCRQSFHTSHRIPLHPLLCLTLGEINPIAFSGFHNSSKADWCIYLCNFFCNLCKFLSLIISLVTEYSSYTHVSTVWNVNVVSDLTHVLKTKLPFTHTHVFKFYMKRCPADTYTLGHLF